MDNAKNCVTFVISNNKKMKQIKVKKGHVLVMKTINEDMSSHHDSSFIYPTKGEVVAHDFVDNSACGNGIHAFLKGEGDGDLAKFSYSKWVIISVLEKSIIKLDGKVKFKSGEVISVGTQQEITAIMKATYPDAAVIGCAATAGYKGTATAGYEGTATAGYEGTATAGDEGTATAGDYGTATAGDKGSATAGDEGTATAGYKGTATAGDKGTATAGDEGTATAGDEGTAKAGDYGTAKAGYKGTATAGDYGTATAGDYGTAKAGYNGVIIIKHWNGEIYVPKVAIVRENGIKPNTPYKLDSEGNFVEA